MPAGVHADQPQSQTHSQQGDTATSEDSTRARKDISASDEGDDENGAEVSAAASVEDSQEESRTIEA
jgi:hypothetical protein